MFSFKAVQTKYSVAETNLIPFFITVYNKSYLITFYASFFPTPVIFCSIFYKYVVIPENNWLKRFSGKNL